jgi:hypothetical protein
LRLKVEGTIILNEPLSKVLEIRSRFTVSRGGRLRRI